MCGIMGYNGLSEAEDILMDSLKRLEYRGYDSAGIAVSGEHGTEIIKTVGTVENLKNKIANRDVLKGTCGIGHTRWATHGGVLETNAHPHHYGKITLVHNGIIENYKEILKQYPEEEKNLASQTDTEIAAMFLNHCYEEAKVPEKAIKKMAETLEGSYAFCILFEDRKDMIYCIRKTSPLVAAFSDTGSFVASDITGFIAYTQDYFVVPEEKILILQKNKIRIENWDGTEAEPKFLHVNWDITAAQKNGYPHFMLKEIFEQPEALKNTILPRMQEKLPTFEADGIEDKIFSSVQQIKIVACGTAMHAGMLGRVLIEQYANIPSLVEIASEFRYQNPILNENTLVILISQSGETIDTLESLRLAKKEGAKTLAIVNVKGSAIARESDFVLYTHAGPEIAVASTKAYTVQIALLYFIAMKFAVVRGRIQKKEVKKEVFLLQESIENVKISLQKKQEIKKIAECLKEKEDLFFIGRGIDYALAMEGSIKLKEISYIHSEAYAAGELKHGTISLITEGVPVIAIATQEKLYTKMVSNVREVKARKAIVILITKESMEVEENLFDYHLTIPDSLDEFTAIPTAVLLQLIAYYTAVDKKLNVDQPRNLAKSVTVE